MLKTIGNFDFIKSSVNIVFMLITEKYEISVFSTIAIKILSAATC
jgi:hypothetical protein